MCPFASPWQGDWTVVVGAALRGNSRTGVLPLPGIRAGRLPRRDLAQAIQSSEDVSPSGQPRSQSRMASACSAEGGSRQVRLAARAAEARGRPGRRCARLTCATSLSRSTPVQVGGRVGSRKLLGGLATELLSCRAHRRRHASRRAVLRAGQAPSRLRPRIAPRCLARAAPAVVRRSPAAM